MGYLDDHPLLSKGKVTRRDFDWGTFWFVVQYMVLPLVVCFILGFVVGVRVCD